MSVSQVVGQGAGGADEEEMLRVLERQRAAQLAEGPPSAEVRTDRINRAIGLLVDHQDEIAEALARDFGHRSTDMSKFTDVMSAIEALKHARKRVRRWMRVEGKWPEFPLGFLGARAEIHHQPKGVVGVISPWNFPVNLTFAPLAGIFAAGNRVMIKPSEFTPSTSALMKRLFREAYEETEVAVFEGGAETGKAFAGLPFDHLLFTGATGVAKHILHAAADHLVPVTLELGGKSPVMLGRSASLEKASQSIANGKMLNAGQICLAPDYVMCPKESLDTFVAAMSNAVQTQYPTLKDNPDYGSVINERHHNRLMGYVEEARERGAEVVEINPAREDFSDQNINKMPLYLVLEPEDDMACMRDEIFGPVLPVKTYGEMDDAIDFVNDHDRPLAVYYFGSDAGERDRVMARTTSGGVSVNEVIMHYAQEELPFGGIGPSGMGRYHGEWGFREFSHPKAVFKQSPIDLMRFLRPPYGDTFRKLVSSKITR